MDEHRFPIGQLLVLLAAVGGLLFLLQPQQPDHNVVVFGSYASGNGEIYTINITDGTVKQLTNEPGDDGDAVWSLDGKEIFYYVFLPGVENNNTGLYVMNADGSDSHELIADVIPQCVLPSPAGNELIYGMFDPLDSQRREINALNPVDMKSHLIIAETAKDGLAASCSPAGKYVAFVFMRDSNRDIYRVDADGSNLKRLTEDTDDELSPTWSPDGQQIAYEVWSTSLGVSQIAVMNADGSHQRRLTDAPGFKINPAWSPDGRQIVYASAQNGKYEIYVMDADGSHQRRLTNNTVDDSMPLWSPDGKYIIFYSIHATYELHIMGTDGSNERTLYENVSTFQWLP